MFEQGATADIQPDVGDTTVGQALYKYFWCTWGLLNSELTCSGLEIGAFIMESVGAE